MIDLYSGSAILDHDWLTQTKCTLDEAEYIANSISHTIKRHDFDEKEYGKDESALIQNAASSLDNGGAIFSKEWLTAQSVEHDRALCAAKYIAIAINSHYFNGKFTLDK